MQDNRFMNTAAATSAQTDVGLRAYMLGVYNHMTTALLLTGFFAFATKWAVLNVAGLGQLLYGTPLKWVIICLLYTSPSPRDRTRSRMPSSA